MAQKVTALEVLRIVVSIGPTEAMHFQTWHDKAGNAPAVTDGSLVFPDLTSGQFATDEQFEKSLIMPEPCDFLRRALPPCSIVRPTATAHVAMGALQALTADGLFTGQSREFFQSARVNSPTRRIGHVEICDDTLLLAPPCHPSLCTFSKEGRGLGRAPLPTATTGTLPDSPIWVIKLHGSVDRRAEHLILARSDYRRHYRSSCIGFPYGVILQISRRDKRIDRLMQNVVPLEQDDDVHAVALDILSYL